MALALTGGASGSVPSAAGQTLETLRAATALQGSDLKEERLRILQPVLQRRSRQLRKLRDAELDDSVEPTLGILIG